MRGGALRGAESALGAECAGRGCGGGLGGGRCSLGSLSAHSGPSHLGFDFHNGLFLEPQRELEAWLGIAGLGQKRL